VQGNIFGLIADAQSSMSSESIKQGVTYRLLCQSFNERRNLCGKKQRFF
jgi:hypothetical protein